MNILFTLNNGFIPQVGTCICSICENNKDADEINFYLFGKEITEKNKQFMQEFVSTYTRTVYFIELNDIQSYFDFSFDSHGWNPIVLARLVLQRLLPQTIDRILYLDGDTIVRGNLQELWNLDMNNHALGACIEPTVDKKRLQNIGLINKPYYNAGVLLFDLKRWRELDLETKVLDFYREAKGDLFANDQDAINGALYDEIITLSPTYNFFNSLIEYNYKSLVKIMHPVSYVPYDIYKESITNPKIVHFLGEERPWRKHNYHRYSKDFHLYLSKTPWHNMPMQDGWLPFFIAFRTFNIITTPVPLLRYQITSKLIPWALEVKGKYRKNVN